MGPSAVRVAGLYSRVQALGDTVEDVGNVAVELPEHLEAGDPRAKYLPEIAATCERQALWVRQTLEAEALPLVLGGDHSIAVGTVSGVSAYYRERDQSIGLIWIDAHGDCNTPATSPSGNIHGMGLACLLGHGPAALTGVLGAGPQVRPQRVALVGVHELDPGEREFLREMRVNVFTMRDIDERGMRPVMADAIACATAGTAGFCASLDLDFIDASNAPGVGTPVRGGATYREAHLAMEMIADSGALLALEAVEVNPVLDEHNRTAELAVELVLSALGKKIL